MKLRMIFASMTAAAMVFAPAAASAAPEPPRPLANEAEAAATTCYAATAFKGFAVTKEFSERDVLDGSWYLAEVVRGKYPASTYLAEMTRIANNMPSDFPLVAENSSAFIAACQERWPGSKKGAALLMPYDPWEKAVTCATVAAYLEGIVTGLQEGDVKVAVTGRDKTIADRYAAQFSDASFKAKGYDTEAKVGQFTGELLVLAAARGNFNDLLDKC